ncbi:MAG: 30S ribosomal protein S6 [Pseudomonadota bacterium]
MKPRRYETLILLDPDISPEEQEKLNEKLTGIIDSMKGRVLRVENWGRRRLAYPVRKQMYGIYVLLDFMGGPELQAEIDRNLRIEEAVSKHLTLILEKDFSEERYEAELERLQAEKAAREAALQESDSEPLGPTGRFGDQDEGDNEDEDEDSDEDYSSSSR